MCSEAAASARITKLFLTVLLNSSRREDHFELDEHNAAAEELERRWHANKSDPACDKLCRIPAYIHEDASRSLWSKGNPSISIRPCLMELHSKNNISMMRNLFFSHCHHHWHPTNPKTGERHPIRGCRTKRKSLQRSVSPKQTNNFDSESSVSRECAKIRFASSWTTQCIGEYFIAAPMRVAVRRGGKLCGDLPP